MSFSADSQANVVEILSESDQEISQPHTLDQPTSLSGRATEQSQYISKTIKVKLPALTSSSR